MFEKKRWDLIEKARGFVHCRLGTDESDGVVGGSSVTMDVDVVRNGQGVMVKIRDYVNLSLCVKMGITREMFRKGDFDFRSQIESVFLDTDYKGEFLNIVMSDLPKKETDFVKGEYRVDLPREDARIAVKVVDILGEEVVVVK